MDIKNITYKKNKKYQEWNLYLNKYPTKKFSKKKDKRCNH